MKLSELAKEPKLTKIILNEDPIIQKYEEPVEFWIYDRVDMETFMALANLEGNQDIRDVVKVMENLILDENGKKILSDGKVLPNDIMIKAVEATVSYLGNEMTQTSES